MYFKFHDPTKVFFGENVVNKNKALFKEYGNKAFIVTGRNSGKLSGALDEVTDVLNEQKIEYMIFEDVLNNPSTDNVKKAGMKAMEYKADFVIGIGGGSPLDAAKAVAVLAVNDIDPYKLFKNVFPTKPIPIIAVPTTAGTGSEVTPYSILTRDDMKTKMSFGNEHTFPVVAFVDYRYTKSMPYETTVSTAVDALTHAVEGYTSVRSTPFSDIIAKEVIRIFGKNKDNIINNNFDSRVREELLYMSMIAGFVISQTGTTIIHAMGYSLTYFKDVSHGTANGVLLKEYLKFIYDQLREKVDNVLDLMGVNNIEEVSALMKKILKYDIELNEKELDTFCDITMKLRSIKYNVKPLEREDAYKIFKESMQ